MQESRVLIPGDVGLECGVPICGRPGSKMVPERASEDLGYRQHALSLGQGDRVCVLWQVLRLRLLLCLTTIHPFSPGYLQCDLRKQKGEKDQTRKKRHKRRHSKDNRVKVRKMRQREKGTSSVGRLMV